MVYSISFRQRDIESKINTILKLMKIRDRRKA